MTSDDDKRADRRDPREIFKLRPPRPGDLGWVVHRHGVLYHEEYGWDASFEALVARVVADFSEQFDPTKALCLIAEENAGGRIAGSAFIVDARDGVAKLRLVYVEPWARGTGIARLLVESCMDFARSKGYRRMTLWTNDVLLPARRLYERLGFQMIASEAYHGFGKDLVSETWERDL